MMVGAGLFQIKGIELSRVMLGTSVRWGTVGESARTGVRGRDAPATAGGTPALLFRGATRARVSCYAAQNFGFLLQLTKDITC